MKSFEIRPTDKDDKKWIIDLLKEWWAGPQQIIRGKIHHADTLPGFIAVKDGKGAGLITYGITGDRCEVVTMNSLVEGAGIGSGLIDAVKDAAISKGCQRLCLITTNDNTKALRFYQKRGFRLAAIYPNAVEKSRELKPEIPLLGNDDIPIRDEIELEMIL